MHHVDKPERVTRAVGVYEWTGELAQPSAARFVPVSLFIEGHMEDAGLYLARPVPFALQTGDVYSLERAGEPEGLLDLDYAQHVISSQALADDDPAGAWYGYGKFTPQAAPKTVPLHASSHPPVILSNGSAPAASAADDGRPHMNRRDTPAPSTTNGNPGAGGTGAGNGSADSAPAKAPASSAPTTAGSGSSPGDADDTDRPTLRHRDPSQDATRRREYGTRSKQASVTAVGPAPGDDPDRPTLGRNSVEDKGVPPLTGLPADLHQAVAVSDPRERDHHDFAREWDTPAERATTLAALEAMARPRVLAYLAANGMVPSSGPLPQESAPAAASPKPAAVAAPPDAADEPEPVAPRLQRGVPSSYAGAKVAAPAPASAPTPPAPTPPAPTPPAPAPVSRAAISPRPNATSHPASRRSTRSGSIVAATLTLAQGQVQGFTLSYGGLPTFVYTAAAPAAVTRPALQSAAGIPGAPSSTLPLAATHPAVFVTVVAQRLPSGDLQIALSNVTDSLHLDRGPRLRLVDAVDPDDSHRASLLFELRGASSRQFALYRLTAAQAEQTFTTASIE